MSAKDTRRTVGSRRAFASAVLAGSLIGLLTSTLPVQAGEATLEDSGEANASPGESIPRPGSVSSTSADKATPTHKAHASSRSSEGRKKDARSKGSLSKDARSKGTPVAAGSGEASGIISLEALSEADDQTGQAVPSIEGQEVAFPEWEPVFDTPALNGGMGNNPKSPYILKVAPEEDEDEERVLSHAETFDEAIRVGALQKGAARTRGFATLWRRYEKAVILSTLTAQIERRSLEQAAVAAEILLQAEPGRKRLLELLRSKEDRISDRAAHALGASGASAVPLLASIFDKSTLCLLYTSPSPRD